MHGYAASRVLTATEEANSASRTSISRRMIEETVYYDQLERIRQLGSVLELDGQQLQVPR